MPTTPDSPPTRWPRFLPKQFSIVSLLVLITIVAGGLWWYVQLPSGTVTAANAKRIAVGLRMEEVERILGKPVEAGSIGAPPTIVWSYHVATSIADEKELTIEFSKGSEIVTDVYHSDLMLVIAH